MKIAIQGVEGCFHQIAANNYFGTKVDVHSCLTFHELVESVKEGTHCTSGIMAIENSIAGSILQNYKLLRVSGLSIIGEIYLRIEQNLIGPKGLKLSEIKEVHSHPMAIYQCDEFLKTLGDVKAVEMEDTALSVKQLRDNSSKGKVAIGSSLSAEIYGMEILQQSIETNKKNYTRFLVVAQNGVDNLEETNKASIYLQLSHQKGSLAKVLQHIADIGINVSKLQSYPIVGTDWLYYFHLDVEYDQYSDFERMMQGIKPYTEEIKNLGNYKKGQK